MEKLNFNENKILEALTRSGYLFESEISKSLTAKGYFVESNKVVFDKFTNKSREIDLIAEYNDDFGNRDYSHRCYAKIKFAFEIKNNVSPLLVLTEYQHSLNDEIWEVIKSYVTIPANMHYHDELWEYFIYNNSSLFTQYCSFQEKKGSKGELMALHPDNIHSGIQKITQYCQEHVGYVENDDTNYLRHWIYVPVLLISENLYELRLDENNIPKISKTEEASLIYNYHFNDKPCSCLVKVVTKNGLDSFLDTMLSLEKDTESKMIEIRKNQNI